MTGLQFMEALDLLGAPLFVLDKRPKGTPVESLIRGEYRAPRGWPGFTAGGNDQRLAAAKPGCAYGMVCGHIYDVLDIDPRNDGETAFQTLVAEGALPPVHWVIATPRGGRHLYIDPLNAGKHPGFMPGIDLQAVNSFVFIPPTEGYRVIPRQ